MSRRGLTPIHGTEVQVQELIFVDWPKTEQIHFHAPFIDVVVVVLDYH